MIVSFDGALHAARKRASAYAEKTSTTGAGISRSNTSVSCVTPCIGVVFWIIFSLIVPGTGVCSWTWLWTNDHDHPVAGDFSLLSVTEIPPFGSIGHAQPGRAPCVGKSVVRKQQLMCGQSTQGILQKAIIRLSRDRAGTRRCQHAGARHRKSQTQMREMLTSFLFAKLTPIFPSVFGPLIPLGPRLSGSRKRTPRPSTAGGNSV